MSVNSEDPRTVALRHIKLVCEAVLSGKVPPLPGVSVYYLAVGNMHIRIGPSSAHESIGFILKGERITALSVSENEEWLEHERGWSHTKYLRKIIS